MSDESWDDEVDLLVLGTGAGGLAAAVTGADQGLSTLVLEKTEYLGGTTAYSAGTCWIPGNRFLEDDNDVEEASRYLDALVGDRAPRELREAYLARGGEMVEYLDRIGVGFWHSKTVVDYHPEIPGVGPRPGAGAADLRRAGLGKAELRPRPAPGPGVRPVRRHADGAQGRGERPARDLRGLRRGVLRALRLGVRWAADRLRYPRGTRLAMGNALVANLFHKLLQRYGQVWFRATATRLLTDDGRVVGAIVAYQGRELRVRVRRGVVLAGAASRRARTGGRSTCRRRPRSTRGPGRARPATPLRSPRPSAGRSASRATTTRSGSPARSDAAATARPWCSRTSGTGPSPASSR